MKYMHKSKQERQLLLQELLYLRYQSTAPDKNNPPKAILPLSCISEMLKIPFETTRWMHRCYFKSQQNHQPKAKMTPTMNIKPVGQSKLTLSNLEPEEFQFIASQHNQKLWATKSLKERCVLFHRTFTDRRISVAMMSKLMRLAGIQKKRIQISSAPARRDNRLNEFCQAALQLDDKLERICKDGDHLVFTDETIFKARDFQREAYSLPGHNLQVSGRTGRQPCQGVVVAICKCHGILAQGQEDYRITQDGFSQMLQDIHGKVSGKVYLFLDGAPFHRSAEIRKTMDELNIEPIFNVAYQYQYQPCERLFSMYKQYYRKILLERMLDDPQYGSTPLKDALSQTFADKFESVTNSIPLFIKHAHKILRRETNNIRQENGIQKKEEIV